VGGIRPVCASAHLSGCRLPQHLQRSRSREGTPVGAPCDRWPVNHHCDVVRRLLRRLTGAGGDRDPLALLPPSHRVLATCAARWPWRDCGSSRLAVPALAVSRTRLDQCLLRRGAQGPQDVCRWRACRDPLPLRRCAPRLLPRPPRGDVVAGRPLTGFRRRAAGSRLRCKRGLLRPVCGLHNSNALETRPVRRQNPSLRPNG